MAPVDPVDLLRSVPVFAGLDTATLACLTKACRRRKYPAHEALFHEGDPGHTLYVILSGQVSVQRVNEMGQTVPIARRGPGECIGELSLLDGNPRSADVETTEPCELLALDSDAFTRCLDDTPGLARRIIACLAARLREAADSADAARSLDHMGRLCTWVLDAMRTSGRALPGGDVLLDRRLTQQEIADRIGSTRETVNRGLARLRKLGALRTQTGRIVVHDAARLKRYAEG